MIDWRNKDAADYYVNEVIGLHTATDKNIDGAETALSLSLCIAKHHIISSEITIICQHSLWTNRTGGVFPPGVFVDSGFSISGSTNLTYASRKASE